MGMSIDRPLQVSRSAWSVIGWVTISPPENQFQEYQNFQNNPKHPKCPKFPKIPNFPKSPDLVDGICPKHKGELFGNFGMNFQTVQNFNFPTIPKFPDLVDGIFAKHKGELFGNFGILGILGNFREILEFLELF